MSSIDRPVARPRPTVAQREAAEERLRRAAADGVLTLEEYGDRVGLVLAAETRDELQAVTADLEIAQPEAEIAPARRRERPARRWIVGIMGGDDVKGRWRPASSTTALAIMGGANVDFREAEVDGGEVTLDAIAVMGGVEVIVPEGVEVEMTGFAFMGGRECKVRHPDSPAAPLLRIRAFAFMGGVEVRNPKPKERRAETGSGAIAASDTRPSTWHPSHVPAHRSDRQHKSWWGKLVGFGLAAALVTGVLGGPIQAVTDAEAVAIMGGRQYTVSEGDNEVSVAALMGGVEVIVPEDHRVRLEGLSLMGGVDGLEAVNAAAEPDAPEITIRANTLMGGVEIVSAAEAGRRADLGRRLQQIEAEAEAADELGDDAGEAALENAAEAIENQLDE